MPYFMPENMSWAADKESVILLLSTISDFLARIFFGIAILLHTIYLGSISLLKQTVLLKENSFILFSSSCSALAIGPSAIWYYSVAT